MLMGGHRSGWDGQSWSRAGARSHLQSHAPFLVSWMEIEAEDTRQSQTRGVRDERRLARVLHARNLPLASTAGARQLLDPEWVGRIGSCPGNFLPPEMLRLML
jgi:hypothetical protein